MSDATHASASTETAANVHGSAERPDVAGRRTPGRGRRILRGLWRWTKRVGIAALVLLVVARLTLGLWLPRAANAALDSYGVHASWQDLDLSLFGLSGQLTGLRAVLKNDGAGAPLDDDALAAAPPLARADAIGFDVDVSALLTGNLRVHRVEAMGVEAWIERDESGRWSYEDLIPETGPEDDLAAAPAVGEPATEAESEPPAPVDFTPPGEIGTVALSLRVHLDDRLEGITTTLRLDATVRGVGPGPRPAEVLVTADAKGVLDGLRIEAAGIGEGPELTVDAEVDLGGLSVRRLAPYLEAVGVRPAAEKLDAHLGAAIALTAARDASATGDGEDDTPIAATGTVRVSDLWTAADGARAAEIAAIEVDVERFAPEAIELSRVALVGGAARAARLEDGVLRVLGLDFVGAPGAPADVQPPEDQDENTLEDAVADAEPEQGSETETAEPESDAPSPGRALRIAAVEVAPFALTFEDAAAPGGAPIEHAVTVGLDASDVVLGAATDEPLRAGVTVAAEGAASLRADLTARLPVGPADPLEADLRLRSDELTLASVRPYLEAAGVTPTFEAGALAVDARVARAGGTDGPVDLEVGPVRLADGGTTLLAVERLAVDDLVQSADGLRIAEVALDGIVAPATLFEGGGFRGFGVASIGGPGAGVDGAESGVPVGLEGGTLRLNDVAFGGAGGTTRITGTLDPVGVADRVGVAGFVRAGAGALDVEAELELSADGIDLEAIAPLLAGVEPTMRAGSFGVQLRATAAAEAARDRDEEPGATRVDAQLTRLALQDDEGAPLIELDRLDVEEYLVGAERPQPGRVTLAGLRAAVVRDADGAVRAAGLRFGAPEPAPAAADAAPAKAASASPRGAPVEESAPDDPGGDPTAPPAAPLASLALDGVAISWSDRALQEPVDLELQVRGALAWESTDDVTRLDGNVELGVPGVLGALTLQPDLRQGAGTLELAAALEATGIDVGPARAYLPPGIETTFRDGSLRLRADVSTGPAEGGGTALTARVGDLSLLESPGAEADLALDGLVLEAPRLDGDGGMFDVASLRAEGVELTVRKVPAEDGARLETCGLAFVAATEENVAGDPPAEDSVDPISGDETDGTEPAETTPIAPAPPGAPRALGEEPPTIRVAGLDLGVERVRYVDETRPGARPLDLSLRLLAPDAQTIAQPDMETLGPVALTLEGAVLPLAREIRGDIELEPFSPEARATVALRVAGIDGRTLPDVDPAFAEAIDLSGWQDGSIDVALEALLSIPKAGPLAFDLDRGVSGTARVAPFHVRATPGAEPTGFESLDVELKKLVPSEGEVHLASVELNGVRARVAQEAAGTRIAGVLLPAAPEADAPGEGEDAPEDEPAPSDVTAPPAERAPGDDPAETRIDRLLVSGVDFIYRDETAEPAFVLPVEDLSLEVQRFSTRTFTEERPFSFRLLVDSGEVTLPERSGSDYLLAGVLGSVAQAATLADDAFEEEERRVWDLLEVSGRMSLGPELRGRVQSTLLGLELPAFRGLVSSSGVEIGDGLVDSRAKIRFRDDGGISLNTKTESSYLSLSEPPDGPISRYLSLPAPLDTVLFLLRNEDGAQVLPVRLDVPETGVSMGSVAALAAQTLGLLITDAVSAAPLRVLGPLGDVAGALGLGAVAPTGETVTLEFTGGAATMAAAARAAGTGAESEAPAEDPLAVLADALRRNTDLRVVIQSTIGSDDIDVARRIGNPPRETLEALAAEKRARKAALNRERAELAARTRALLSVGEAEEAAACTEELRALDIDYARLESSIDELFGRLRPGAERRADMRTRNAALALARERQARVRAALLELAGPAARDRVDVRRPRYVPPKEGAEPLPPLGTVTLTPK